MLGLVIYSDGGAKGNPGAAGSGRHGYLFEYSTPKQGSGHAKCVLTQRGYVMKEDYLALHRAKKLTDEHIPLLGDSVESLGELFGDALLYQVTPLYYFDSVTGYGSVQSNNYAELQSVLECLKLIESLHEEERQALATVEVVSDSEYVVKGVNQYLEKWSNNNYRRADGTPIANEVLWQEMDLLLRNLKDAGVEFKITWVRGHDGNVGNELADSLASMGCSLAENETLLLGSDRIKTRKEPAKGYWKVDVEKPVLLYNRYVLFNPAVANADAQTYFTCTTSQHLRFLGARQADAGFAIVHYTTAPEDLPSLHLLDNVQARQSELLNHQPVITAIDTNVLLNSEVMDQVQFGGVNGLTVGNDFRRELFTAGRTAVRKAVTQVINPPYLSYRILDVLDGLEKSYDAYLNKRDDVKVTDITDLFYETVEKTVKKEVVQQTQLRKEINVGLQRMECEIDYDTLLGEGDTCRTGRAEVILVLGRDLPDRNTLKRLEDRHPRIRVLALPESPHIFSYVVYIETDDGWILSSSVYSNIRLINSP